jgi:hypothetical protein
VPAVAVRVSFRDLDRGRRYVRAHLQALRREPDLEQNPENICLYSGRERFVHGRDEENRYAVTNWVKIVATHKYRAYGNMVLPGQRS